MHPRMRNIGAYISAACNFALIAKPDGSEVAGNAYEITGDEGLSLSAIVLAQANLDEADTLIVSAIAVEADDNAGFSSPTDVGTASNITLTGGSGASDVDYFGEAKIDIDLTQLPEGTTHLRITATPTLSDTSNTDGRIAGMFVFGGASPIPVA